MTADIRAIAAARNNADLYCCVFEANGVRFDRSAHSLVAIDPPPPYYANLTTFSPADEEEQRILISSAHGNAIGGFAVKDSFSAFDLNHMGLKVLFKAFWLWAPARTTPVLPAKGWHRISDELDLALWEEGWKQAGSPTDRDMFTRRLLDMGDIAFFGRRDDHGFHAGCIVNRSDDCVGLSNIFSRAEDPADYEAATTCALGFAAGMNVVSYDRGGNLNRMGAVGFQSVGSLRVWIMPPAD